MRHVRFPGEKHWNFDQYFSIEVGPNMDGNAQWIDIASDSVIPPEIVAEIKSLYPEQAAKDDCMFNIVLTVNCEGYHTPAKLSGPPERCYPEEGEDNRMVTGGKVFPPVPWNMQTGGYDNRGKKLSKVVVDKLESMYQNDIEDMELEGNE